MAEMAFTIPLPLRAFSFETFSKPRPREWALKGYAFAAKFLALSLSKAPLVQRIELRGGSVSRCVPAVSELDLTVYLERDLRIFEWKEWVPRIRSHSLTLKTLCPLLGEPLFLDPLAIRALQEVAPFLNLALQQTRTLVGTEVQIHYPVPVLEKRWPQVFHCYATALREWVLELRGRARAYHRACVARSVHQARLALYGAAELTQAEGTSPQLLAALYRALEMALAAHEVTPEAGTPAPGELSLLWQARLHPEFPTLLPTGSAFTVGTEVEAKTVFETLQKILKAHLQDPRFQEPPLLLPPKAQDLAWAQTEAQRTSVPVQRDAGQAWIQSLSRKLVVQAVRLPSDLASVPAAAAWRSVEALRLDAAQLVRLCPRAESLRPHLENAQDVFSLRKAVLSLKIWD